MDDAGMTPRWYARGHAGELKDAFKHAEHMKAAVRSKVEHLYGQLGYQKVRFKGLFKNTAKVLTLFALSNLWMARRTLLACAR